MVYFIWLKIYLSGFTPEYMCCFSVRKRQMVFYVFENKQQKRIKHTAEG